MYFRYVGGKNSAENERCVECAVCDRCIVAFVFNGAQLAATKCFSLFVSFFLEIFFLLDIVVGIVENKINEQLPISLPPYDFSSAKL